ncbi:MAG: competence protein CoiA family protein [Spirulina sp.]
MRIEEGKEKKKKIKYSYAWDNLKKLVFVGDLENSTETRKREFTCISCGNLLIPKLGKIKQKHFAHKNICDCSFETYLHLLAKEIFLIEYNKCLDNNIPFYVEVLVETYCDANKEDFNLTCELGSKSQKYDITKKYKKIQKEVEVDGFIPDLLLSTPDNKEKLFIEIFVTHKSTENKIKSGFNIIEIQIKSEDDIDLLRSRVLSEQENINFYGFNIKPVRTVCAGDLGCPHKKRIFNVFENGKSICITHGLPGVSTFLKRITQTNIIYYEIIDFDYYWDGEDYVKKVIEVYGKGIPIRNCYLCRYQGDNHRWDNEGKPIFCRFLKIRCNSNQASECQYFRV